MARLTEVQRGQAIALLMQGQTQRQVAMQFGVNVSTIKRLVRRLRETGRLADRPRTGRPRVTTRRQDRAIRLAHLCNRYVTATETANNTIGNHNRHIHPKTVRNRLREPGLRCRRPCVGLPRRVSLVHVTRVKWLGWRHMPPEYFQWGNGDRSFSLTSRDSPFFVRMVDVVYTDVVGNVSPTQALLRWIGLVVDQLWSGVEYLTGLSHRWLCWVGPWPPSGIGMKSSARLLFL